RAPDPMASGVPQAILAARRATGLTQQQLAARLGLKAHAIGRWEKGQSTPHKRNQRALVLTIRERHPAAADELAAALRGHSPEAGVEPKPPTPPPPDPSVLLQLAVFRMADELDMPPRRVRGPLMRLLRRVRAAELSIDDAAARIE